MKKKVLITSMLGVLSCSLSFAQEFSNSGMETWESQTYSAMGGSDLTITYPTGWSGSDRIMGENLDVLSGLAIFGIDIQLSAQIAQSEDAHSGSSAAAITSVSLGDSFGVVPGMLTNAVYSLQIDPTNLDMASLLSNVTVSGGTAVNGKKVDTVYAWVKLDTSNTDQAVVTLSALTQMPGSDTNTVIGAGSLLISPSDEGYVRVAVPMEYLDENMTATDTLIVTFASSATQAGTEGNTLLVDDVSMVLSDGHNNGIELPLLSEKAMYVYPNPATQGYVYFNLNASLKPAEFSLMITDISGKTLYNQTLSDHINKLDCSAYANGTYFYTLIHNPSQQKESGKIVLSQN